MTLYLYICSDIVKGDFNSLPGNHLCAASLKGRWVLVVIVSFSVFFDTNASLLSKAKPQRIRVLTYFYSIYLVAADAKYVFSFEHPQVATSIQKTGLVILHYALLLHLETATLSNT